MSVYLLHSDTKIGRAGTHGASHYIGYAPKERLWQRLAAHAMMHNSPAIIRRYHSLGATLYLAALYLEGTLDLERYIKSQGHHEKRCPICRGLVQMKDVPHLGHVLALWTTHGERLSSRLTTMSTGAPSLGTTTANPGALLQPPLQNGPTPLGLEVVHALLTPGGRVSNATAQMKVRNGSSATTRQRSFVVGSTPLPTAGMTNREKRTRLGQLTLTGLRRRERTRNAGLRT